MKVQAFSDCTANVFLRDKLVCTVKVLAPLKGDFDRHLALLYLYRKGAWRQMKWGSEANFYFKRGGSHD